MTEIEHYGDSLESHPGFLFMKKMWLEDQIDLEKEEDSLIFVDPPKINSKEIFAGVNFNLIKETDEKDILRSTMGTSQTGEDDRQMDLRRETSV
jgi:hypothetical protein